MKKKIWILFCLSFCLFLWLPVNASAKTIRLKPKQTYQLQPNNIIWKIKNKKIININKNGLITAKKNGSTTITGKAGNRTYQFKVVVKTPITVSKSIIIYKTDKTKIKISGVGKSTKRSFRSKNKKIATVNKSGIITGIKPGSTTITTKIKGKKYKTTIKVIENQEYQSIYVPKGQSKKLIFTSLYTKGFNHYSVSSLSYGSVTNGIYTSKNYGKNKVICSNGKHKKTFTIYNYCWEAHRGYTKYYPENSIESIKDAKRMGANSVEIDVRPTKDGEFILMHDSTLDRLTSQSGSISKKNLQDLVSTNILYKNGRYYKIATLNEALTTVRALHMNATVHIKTLPTTTLYSKSDLIRRLKAILEPYRQSIPVLTLVVTSKQPLEDWISYSNSNIEIRLGSGYFTEKEEKYYKSKSRYVMSSHDHGMKHYNGYYHTLDNPY